jgi:hypothetical protein
MPEQRVYLHLITLFHPDVFLGIEQKRLAEFPIIPRDRTSLERDRQAEAKKRNVGIHYEMFHDRLISNLGKGVNSFRKTWIFSERLHEVLCDYDVRLIHTSEKGSQAQYRCEFRPDWSSAAACWPPRLQTQLLSGIRRSAKISARQLWRNPISAKFGNLPLKVSESSITETANLVLGPFDKHEAVREAPIAFEKHENAWWVVF